MVTGNDWGCWSRRHVTDTNTQSEEAIDGEINLGVSVRSEVKQFISMLQQIITSVLLFIRMWLLPGTGSGPTHTHNLFLFSHPVFFWEPQETLQVSKRRHGISGSVVCTPQILFISHQICYSNPQIWVLNLQVWFWIPGSDQTSSGFLSYDCFSHVVFAAAENQLQPRSWKF